MDSDNTDHTTGSSEAPRDVGANANERPEGQSFRIPSLNMFSRKPRLRPEVIELGIPRSSDDPSTSSNVNQSNTSSGPPAHTSNFTHSGDNRAPGSANVTYSHGDSLNGREDENEGVFDTHIAVLYDRYLNFKESLSNKIRDKIMAFMRDDLEDDPTDEEMDVEGGFAPLQTDSTYDRLVFITTILLGFVFRSPLLWVVGSFLFLIYGNFKRKIVKWGLLNVFLTILSIVYGAQTWSYTDPEVFSIKPGARSILLSRLNHLKLEKGVLSYEGKDAVILSIEGNQNLKWSIIQKKTEHKLRHGNFSNELLVDSKLIPKGTDMIRLNHEIMIKGLVQLSVKFKTSHPTPGQSYELPKSHYYPLYHNPSNRPYEVSFECHPAEPGTYEVDHTGGTFYHIDFEEGVKDVNSKHRNLKGLKHGKFPLHAISTDEEDYDNVDVEKIEHEVDDKIRSEKEKNLPVKAFEDEKDTSNEPPIKVDPQKKDEEKMYIGVDATESDVYVTRLFKVNTLSRCSLVHIPKNGTDVVSVYIKRLQ